MADTLNENTQSGAVDGRAVVRFCAAGLGVVASDSLRCCGVCRRSSGVSNDRLSARPGMQLLDVLVPARLYVGKRILAGYGTPATVFAVMGYAGAYGLSLTVKGLKYYWLLALPFLGALAALEAKSLYRRGVAWQR